MLSACAPFIPSTTKIRAWSKYTIRCRANGSKHVREPTGAVPRQMRAWHKTLLFVCIYLLLLGPGCSGDGPRALQQASREPVSGRGSSTTRVKDGQVGSCCRPASCGGDLGGRWSWGGHQPLQCPAAAHAHERTPSPLLLLYLPCTACSLLLAVRMRQTRPMHRHATCAWTAKSAQTAREPAAAAAAAGASTAAVASRRMHSPRTSSC